MKNNFLLVLKWCDTQWHQVLFLINMPSLSETGLLQHHDSWKRRDTKENKQNRNRKKDKMQNRNRNIIKYEKETMHHRNGRENLAKQRHK